MNLGKRLKAAREKRGMTQEQLADAVPGASQAMISALESRDSETTTLLFSFARALHINPEWLQDERGDSGLGLSVHEPTPPRYGVSDADAAMLPLASEDRNLLTFYRAASPLHRMMAIKCLTASADELVALSSKLMHTIFKNSGPSTQLLDSLPPVNKKGV